MKNFFSILISKSKGYINSLNPTERLRFVMLSALSVVIVASLLLVVALSRGTAKIPDEPKGNATGDTVAIDFDTEIIFDVDGEDSVDTASDTESVNDEVPESAEVDTEDKTTAEAVETEEVTTEQHADPSRDDAPDSEHGNGEGNAAPLPSEPPIKQTEADPKPIETTSKQTASSPRPTETAKQTETPKQTETTKQDQSEPKPTETTKQVDDEPHASEQFSLKEKKYDYNGANVTILHMENKSSKAYTVTLTGKFKDSDGNVIKTESKTFEGFPAGWSNYFVFEPGIKYSSVSWSIRADDFKGNTLAEHLYLGDSAYYGHASKFPADEKGNIKIPTNAEEAASIKYYAFRAFGINNLKNNYQKAISFTATGVFFDANGNIAHIGKAGTGNVSAGSTFSRTCDPVPTGILYEDYDVDGCPDELKSVTGFFALESISVY